MFSQTRFRTDTDGEAPLPGQVTKYATSLWHCNFLASDKFSRKLRSTSKMERPFDFKNWTFYDTLPRKPWLTSKIERPLDIQIWTTFRLQKLNYHLTYKSERPSDFKTWTTFYDTTTSKRRIERPFHIQN